MHEYFNKMKTSFEYYSIFLAMVLAVTFTPNSLQYLLVENAKKVTKSTSLVFSNVPGP